MTLLEIFGVPNALLIWIVLFPVVFVAALWGWSRIPGLKGSKWGVSLPIPTCPTCGTKPPAIRWPRSFAQALWGGWTCQKCGQELDKWGAKT